MDGRITKRDYFVLMIRRFFCDLELAQATFQLCVCSQENYEKEKEDEEEFSGILHGSNIDR